MSKRLNILLFAFTVISCLILGDLAFLFAQEAASEEFTLEEITVTAQKREENQQKVPIAMEVISAEEIKEQGKNDIREILSNVSSALIQKASDGYRISIRGMADDSSAESGQSTAVPTVAINTDGVYSNRKDSASSLYDIERVEVLYGPQSTMYSSNSPGGIINIITAQPKTDKFSVNASLELGNYNLIHTEGAVNVPLSERFAIRASFTTSRRDGYLSNGSDEEDSKSARLRGLFKATDDLSFTLTGEISKSGGAGFGGGVEPFGNQDERDDPWISAESDNPTTSDRTTKKVSGQVSWDSFLGALTLIPSYSKGEGTREQSTDEEVKSYTQDSEEKGVELRITSPSEFFLDLEWILGATYYNAEDSSYWYSDDYLTSNGEEGEYSDRVMTNKNRAIYANVTYPLWFYDKFRLTLGYRQSWDKMISDNKETKPDPVDPSTVAEMDQYQIEENEGEPDWKYGFEFDLAENIMIYGDYSSSYRVQGMGMGGGGGGGGGAPPASFSGYAQSFVVPAQSSDSGDASETEPTKLKAYTIGAKSRFLGNKLQVNVSAYYYDYKNYQANKMVILWFDDDSDGIVEETDNNGVQDSGETENEPNSAGTGDGEIIGFDLQTSAIITSKDMLTISVSYIKSEWKTLDFDYTYTWTYKLDEDGNRYVYNIGDGDYRGEPMMNTPPWTVNLNYTHNFTLWNGGNLRVGITSKYQTEYSLSWYKEDYPYNFQETYHMENVTGTYTHTTGKWTLSGYVNNVFDYAEKTMYMGDPANMMSIGSPRTYGAVLSLKF